MDKYLSIITNFGCHHTCPYCIVKNNNLHIPKTTLDGLRELPKAIAEHKPNWISISGGGDPLFNIENNMDWYDEMLWRATPINIKTEMHTSYIELNEKAAEVCSLMDRVVYHVRDVKDISKVKKYDDDQEQITRVVFVVTEDFTPEKIDKIVAEVKRCGIDELSFRQMVDDKYETTHYCEEYLKAGHKKDWYYIEQNDYNLYYCENEVSYRYKDFERVREE